MSLYIRDNAVDALAEKVRELTQASNKTEAVRRALQNEIARVQKAIPLRERIRTLQDSIKSGMGPLKPDFDTKKFNDDMWGL